MVSGKLRSFGLVIAAGTLAFMVFVIWLLLGTFLVEYFKSQGMLEAQLFVGSFLKPIALVWLAGWVLLSGVFLKRAAPTKWGRRLFYIYVAVCVVPYFLSFGVTSTG